MRLRTLVIAGSLVLLAGCGDDGSDETRTDRPDAPSTSTTGPDTPADTPEGSGQPDPSGDPPGSEPDRTAPSPGGTLPDRPADLAGEVTEFEGDRFLVEEHPDRPDTGRKAWVGIEGPVFRAGGGGDPEPASPSDVAVGQRVSAWTDICALSYPEQCAAHALVIE